MVRKLAMDYKLDTLHNHFLKLLAASVHSKLLDTLMVHKSARVGTLRIGDNPASRKWDTNPIHSVRRDNMEGYTEIDQRHGQHETNGTV